MPQRVFYIDKEKQRCLTATWKSDWLYFKLFFQDEVVCSLVTKKELVTGRQFVMPDGHLLSVRLTGGLQPELEVLRDGLPLLAKPTDESRRNYKTYFQLALFLGVVNITAGIVAAVTNSDIMLSIGFGYGSIAVGAAYMLLVWGIRHLQSFAVYAIAGLISIDIVLLFVFTAMREGPTSPTSGMLIKLFLVYAFVKGVGAMKQIRSQAAETVI